MKKRDDWKYYNPEYKDLQICQDFEPKDLFKFRSVATFQRLRTEVTLTSKIATQIALKMKVAYVSPKSTVGTLLAEMKKDKEGKLKFHHGVWMNTNDWHRYCSFVIPFLNELYLKGRLTDIYPRLKKTNKK